VRARFCEELSQEAKLAASGNLEMNGNIHSFMQYPHDVDALIRHEVKNQMFLGGIDPQVWVDFIVKPPKLRPLGERFESTVQGAQICFGLIPAPV
jgi:hypothetical protein